MLLKLNNGVKTAYFLLLAAISSYIFAQPINIELIYHKQQALFLFDFNVFLSSFSSIGGFIDYLANFLTELFYYPVLGSIVLSLLLGTIPLLVYSYFKRVANETISLLFGSIVFILSLLLFVNYSFKLSSFLTILVAYLILTINTRIIEKTKKPFITIVILTVLSIISFIILGGIGLVVTNGFLIFRMFKGDRPRNQVRLISVVLIIITGLLPFFAVRLFFQLEPLNVAYLGDFISSKYYHLPIYYYILFFFLVFIELFQLINIKWDGFKSDWNYWVVYIFFILIVWQLPLRLIDQDEKSKVEIDYYAYHKQWNEVINKLDNHLLQDQLVVFQANRALYHTGVLLDNVYSIPQYFGSDGLLVERQVNSHILIPASDIYYDLGFINESRHWAHEAFSIFGKQARVLRRLVEVNIINKNYRTAQKYILLLKKSMVNRKWALEQEKYLNHEDTILANQIYWQKRKEMPLNDFFANQHEPTLNLINLNEQIDSNNMAFEYLAASYLMHHDLAHIINIIPKFEEYNYKTLPNLIQQAVILYMVKTKKSTLNLSGYQLSIDNYQKFKEYSQLYMQYRNNNYQAKEKLSSLYSDTFWYYLHFISPRTKISEQKNR